MKILLVTTILVLTSSHLWAAVTSGQTEQDFKCYITSKKDAEIAFYRWKTSEMSLRMASLVGSLRQSNDGQKFYINTVEECVVLSESFSSSKAQELDRLTPR